MTNQVEFWNSQLCRCQQVSATVSSYQQLSVSISSCQQLSAAITAAISSYCQLVSPTVSSNQQSQPQWGLLSGRGKPHCLPQQALLTHSLQNLQSFRLVVQSYRTVAQMYSRTTVQSYRTVVKVFGCTV